MLLFAQETKSYVMHHQQVVFAAVASAGIATIVYWMWKKKQIPHDKDYIKVGKISKIFFHPVKSLRGIEVEKAKCTKVGIEVDSVFEKSFMLVSENKNFISQRKEPRLAMLRVNVELPNLCFDGPNMSTLTVCIKKKLSASDKIWSCRVWGQEIGAVDCGDEAASWFQNFLEKPGIRLVQYLPQIQPRPAVYSKNPNHKLTDYPILFQDGSTYHMLSQSSVDDLNSKLEKKITARNFRPNFLVADCQPYDEDKWKHVKVSSGARFIHLKNCDRCVMTTVDPDTGIKDGIQPLETLKTYRLPSHLEISSTSDKSPFFGVDLGLEKSGEIKVGDDLFAVVGNSATLIEK